MRAKFYVHSIKFAKDYTELELWPVYSSDPNHENKAFWDATPSGKITLGIKRGIADHFKPGDEYYIDFTLAEVVTT